MNTKVTDPTASTDPAPDGSAEVLRRALPLMSRHAAGFSPESYAVWYEYVRGNNIALRTEVDTLVRGGERLTHEVTFDLHQRHLIERSENAVREAGDSLIDVMHSVRTSVEAASSDANDFDAQLAAFGEGIAAANSADAVRQQVTAMREDVTRMNRSMSTLTSQLESSRATVARLEKELQRVRDEACLDPLAGIVNRRGFDIELARMCREATAANTTLCVVMIDIDFFKNINDTWGHPFGDQVIQEVGIALREQTHRKDVAARYGGEEFALLLPETPLAGAREVAERIRDTIERARLRDGGGDSLRTAKVTISAGVARYVPGENSTSLLARVDRALYASKWSGRNRVTVAPG